MSNEAPTNLSAHEIVAFWRDAGPELWFAHDRDFDGLVRWKWFGAHQAAAFGRLDAWASEAEGALALILLLDQFPRNIFRGLARAFGTDAKAVSVAQAALAQHFDQQYSPPMQRFFYLPFMHSEDLAEQEFCVEKCRASDDAEGVKFAEMHRDIIRRFGRFPHRNVLLGRISTAQEQAFLDAGGFAG